MLRGLYTAGIGMMAQMQRMDVTTNNLANADTAGYKKDTVITRSFSDELTMRLNDQGGIAGFPGRTGVIGMNGAAGIGNISQGLFVDTVLTNFANGTPRGTGSDMDFALNGDGFFTVYIPAGPSGGQTVYTRDGSFTLTPDGHLATLSGGFVMGQNGPVTVGPGGFSVDKDGAVSQGGRTIDHLNIAGFADNQTLRKLGNNLFAATPQSAPKAFQGTVEQGFLEASNVNAVSEMVDMIALSRAYEANARVVTAYDTLMGHTANDIGRV